MSYTKLNPQPTGLLSGETAVQLETGDKVAVAASCSVEANSGNPVISVTARVINDDGSDKLDAIGQSMKSAFVHTSCMAELALAGSGSASAGVPVVQKCAFMAVLGEPTDPLWTDAIHATALATASIRTNITSAAHAGPVNAGALL